ncbi:hypothetical protein DSCA_08730 [Desulfosarcina alkanivorans]|uniref:Uncharacterized protein n=1 Tax=Desulfosarcina alkanivorans TaxID=571177 RepID=A0A5K7YE64_9BACT|nr:hypothetical protein [Desulfosarcina alkanivorans]BBO66943.1 hypothetical protein DSCA_08730 [Desulfosarcina alkanivorans]
MPKSNRSFIERRTGKDRRRRFSIKGLFFRQRDRRCAPERRSGDENRKNWVRVSKWSSVPLKNLKISKYLLKECRLDRNHP